ncbi:hypothetical protein SAMN05444722_0183 [Rhodovulum sp. ES.010]|uniref:hypothetical protein n=1 Tax=Rhodovulum sp. ES.010 TaxID=1882821 RepID=UPI00092A1704|nr:hypothetical protein [Rhodovulum sp. ES.010]SIO03401.1 hypothetical protein SAMN05444722_0183 [Rhodovulum sp. ES.010]
MSRELAFLVSPSTGIVDNWLPVLAELKTRDPAHRLTVILPQPKFVDEIRSRSLLIRSLDRLTDRVIWRAPSGTWRESDSLMAIIGAAGAQKPLTGRISAALGRGRGRSDRPVPLAETRLIGARPVLLYDVYEEHKPYNAGIVPDELFSASYSLCHGINIADGGRTPSARPGFRATESALKPDTFLFSELERPYYRETYGLPEDRLHAVGIPRHEPDWVARVRREDAAALDPLPERFIGLISRSHNPSYLPKGRKLAALKALKRVADEVDLPIVVKRHPKQRGRRLVPLAQTDLYETAFGAAGLGRTWFETNAHWFALAPRCAFALSFFSGVVTDMAALGVPAVEWLDLAGLPECDTADALRASDGTPAFPYRYLGLVAAATTEADLRRFAQAAIERREETAAPMTARYREIFGDPRGAVARVADRIAPPAAPSAPG